MEIRNYIAILWRRKLPILLTLITTIVVVGIATKLVTPVYETSTDLRIAVSASRSLSYYDYIYSDRLMNTYIEITTSNPVIEELQGRMQLSYTPQITAEIIPDTEMIKITVEDTDPIRAATIANTLVEILLSQEALQYEGGKMSPQKLLMDQIDQAKTEFEQALQYYYSVQALILPNTQQLEAAEQSLQIKQDYYVGVYAQYEELTLQADSQANAATQAEKETLAKQREILAQRLEQAKIELDQAQETYNTLQIQALSNSQRIDAAEQLLKSKRDFYSYLNEQYLQTIMQDEIQANMITVVNSAVVPQTPSRPNVALNYALGLMVGLIGGIGLAFFYENLDTTIYTTNEIETATNMTAMGKIPKASSEQLGEYQAGSSPFGEAFRNLSTLIQKSTVKKQGKVLLVFSAQPKQGKSTIIFHLACSLAEFGKKVLVIDCDTRLPKIHTLFHLQNQPGLQDILERNLPVETALQRSSFEGIDVLTSGLTLDHPGRQLASSKMAKMIAQLKQQYDYILLDSPAMSFAVDVEILASYADTLIPVARRTQTNLEDLQSTRRFIEDAGEKSVFLIVNQANINHGYDFYQYTRKPKSFLSRFIKENRRGLDNDTDWPPSK